MARYVARQRLSNEYSDEPFRPDITVYEPHPEPTGILDHDGNEIVRIMDAIGFVRFED